MAFSNEFKVALTKEIFRNDDGAGLHDAIYEATDKTYTDDVIKQFFMDLPTELQCLALEWGLSDTQFRDDVYTCLKNGKIREAE